MKRSKGIWFDNELKIATDDLQYLFHIRCATNLGNDCQCWVGRA